MKRLFFLVAMAVCIVSSCTQYEILPPPPWISTEKPDVSGIILNETELSLEKDETYQLNASFSPSGSSAALSWKSSNDDILKVDDTGRLTAVATGNVTVTVSVADNPSINAICNVSVVDVVLKEGTSLAELLEEKGLQNASVLSIAGTLSDSDFTTLKGMENLQQLDIANTSNTEIPTAAFSYTSLITINLPENLKTIGPGAFYKTKLKTINLTEKLETIGADAFSGGVDGLLEQMDELVIPASVKSIGARAFSRAGFSSVIFNEGLETINQSAFAYIGFTSIEFPASLKNLADNAFSYKAMESVTFKGEPPVVLYFLQTDDDPTSIYLAPDLTGMDECTVYVKPEYVDAYKTSMWFTGTDAYQDATQQYVHTDYFSEENLKTIGS